MPNFKSLQHPSSLLLIAGLFSAILRSGLALNGGKSLFDTGPDAPSYEAAARDFFHYGWLSDQIYSLPYYPAGYPFFQSLFMHLSSEYWWIILIFFQNFLLVAAVFHLAGSLKLILPNFNSIGYILLLLFLPSFIYLPNENMYESILASSLMFGVSASIRLSSKFENSFRSYLVISIVAFGFAGFIQVKTTLVGFMVLMIAGFVRSRRIFYFAPLVFWGVILNLHRSYIALGILSPSTNFGSAIQISGTKTPCTPTDYLGAASAQIQSASDQQFISCAIKFFASHPLDFLTHAIRQGKALFGPLKGAGDWSATTWYHGLELGRVLDILGIVPNNLFVIQNVLSGTLNIAILIGFFVSLRNSPRWLALFMVSPILIISSVHLISDGDSRYRLPFLPFQFFFLVLFCSLFLQKLRTFFRIPEKH